MADPRFFDNLGPFTLAQICEKAGIAVPAGADAQLLLHDLADLGSAGPQHLSFFSGASTLREVFAAARAGVCLIPASGKAVKSTLSTRIVIGPAAVRRFLKNSVVTRMRTTSSVTSVAKHSLRVVQIQDDRS